MKKVIFLLSSFVFLTNCSTNNSINVPLVDGARFEIKEIILETAVDLNGDGIFSNDLISEGSTCALFPLDFLIDGKVVNPALNNTVSLIVNDDGSGNLSQDFTCLNFAGPLPMYEQKDNQIDLVYIGASSNLGFLTTGILSDDGIDLEFVLTFEQYIGFSYGTGGARNQILNSNGTITEYQGSVTLRYKRL